MRRAGFCPVLRADCTKMFHVKRFGTIGAENLTRLQTAPHFDFVRSVDILEQGRRHRLDRTTGCQDVAPVSVSFEATMGWNIFAPELCTKKTSIISMA